ncbi:MAG: DUF4846 domain-containing protein [Bacteroidetes bacterium]|nr:DUF4846 domain-containing protein [Bacteroidota bacterium]
MIMLILLVGCTSNGTNLRLNGQLNHKDSCGKTAFSRFSVPEGYNRIALPEKSFGYYLRNISLKPDTAKVHLFDGRLKSGQSSVAAVLDLDVGKKDLQQCADAILRLRAEYLWKQGLFSKINFQFTNGFQANYLKWANGFRIRVNGNQCNWYKGAQPDKSYAEFRKYLEMVYMYAGTISLSNELKKISMDSIFPGDVFVQGGSPGHAIIVLDIAIDSATGKRMAMLAQSYSPAQDIHILNNLAEPNQSPWFLISGKERIVTPEWTFNKSDLKRF